MPRKRFFTTTLHSALLVYYAYVDHKVMDSMDKAHSTMGRRIDDPEVVRWRNGAPYYFTFWNLLLHQVYFTCCCIENFLDFLPISGPIDLQVTARRSRRLMLASVLFPSACTVVSNFWFMYLAAPNLIFGEFLDAGPSWVNHSCHTFVFPIALMELYLRATTEGLRGTAYGLYVLFAMNTAYIVTAAASVALRGCWPYPFLDTLSNGLRLVFFASVYGSSWVWFAVQTHLVTNVWGKIEEAKEDGGKSPKKKKAT